MADINKIILLCLLVFIVSMGIMLYPRSGTIEAKWEEDSFLGTDHNFIVDGGHVDVNGGDYQRHEIGEEYQYEVHQGNEWWVFTIFILGCVINGIILVFLIGARFLL